MEIQARKAIVTGGGSGIGAGICRYLVGRGVDVVICGRRPDPLERLAQELATSAGKVLPVQADVSQWQDVERVVRRAADAFGAVDFLVNNAGIGGGSPIHRHDMELWDQVMAVNLKGPFLMARAVLPLMRAQKSGHIINISSESATTHYEGNGAYGVSKHGLNALSEYIQVENQELGIRVDTICPGMVVTEMTKDNPGLDHDKCLQPEDIAELVGWLLSRRPNIKIGTPILIQTMKNPWE